ncbi:MAG: DUF86 domain-containing protein [Planctomycetes bacterium]|nr:DUF86 domain-containing protein [Planctomycetota bacterium]
MSNDDLVRIKHMLDAAKEAVFFAKDKSKIDLNKDRMLVLSLVKEIEIIGEAASKISDKLKTKYFHIPWLDIIGMRNHLIHAYFDVDLDLVWKTVTHDLPFLITELEKIIPSKTDA